VSWGEGLWSRYDVSSPYDDDYPDYADLDTPDLAGTNREEITSTLIHLPLSALVRYIVRSASSVSSEWSGAVRVMRFS